MFSLVSLFFYCIKFRFNPSYLVAWFSMFIRINKYREISQCKKYVFRKSYFQIVFSLKKLNNYNSNLQRLFELNLIQKTSYFFFDLITIEKSYFFSFFALSGKFLILHCRIKKNRNFNIYVLKVFLSINTSLFKPKNFKLKYSKICFLVLQNYSKMYLLFDLFVKKKRYLLDSRKRKIRRYANLFS